MVRSCSSFIFTPIANISAKRIGEDYCHPVGGITNIADDFVTRYANLIHSCAPVSHSPMAVRIFKLALVYANQRRRSTLAGVNTLRREMEMSSRINE